MGQGNETEHEPLVTCSSVEGPATINSNLLRERPVRDLWAGITFLVFLGLTLAGGVYAFFARSDMYQAALDTSYMADPASCPAPHQRGLQEAKEHHVDLEPYLRSGSLLLLLATAASIVGGFLFLHAFKHHSWLMVRVTVAFQIGVPLGSSLAFFGAGQVWPGLMCLGLALLLVLVFYLWWGHMKLCARLLGVSANGLHDNPWLVVACVLKLLASVGILVPIITSLGFSFTNGSIQPNGAAVGQSSGRCVDSKGAAVPCCTFVPEAWVPLYAVFNIVTMFWTAALMGEIRRFVLAATISHWYFAEPGASLQGTTRASLKLALGPSFGTCAFGSAVLAVVQMIRNAAEKQRRGNSDNILMCMLACALECCLQFIEFLTRFAIVRAAITGEAFLSAGRNAAELFKRNFLKAYAVWWIPPMVLRTAAFLASLLYGGVVFVAAWSMWRGQHSLDEKDSLNVAIGVGAVAAVLSVAVHSFFAGILLNIVDVVFMCYAMDRDTQAVTKAEVHEIMGQLPVGVAVENPDGNLNYGAPASSDSNVTYAPPAQVQLPPRNTATQGPSGPGQQPLV